MKMKVLKSIRFELSCYCCGGTYFENKEINCNKVEDMYFLHTENDDTEVKCLKCVDWRIIYLI